MNEKQRQKNEIEYESWIEKEDGGRIYWLKYRAS